MKKTSDPCPASQIDFSELVHAAAKVDTRKMVQSGLPEEQRAVQVYRLTCALAHRFGTDTLFATRFWSLVWSLVSVTPMPLNTISWWPVARQSSISRLPISVMIRYYRPMAIIETHEHELDPAAALFHSLSDTTRLSIVKRMAHGELRVRDLTVALGLAQSTVSAHIACLRDCQLVQGRNEGRSVYYSLTNPELMEMLAKAEILLAATGNAVGLCPNYGIETLEHQIKGIEKR
jgi:DNA-binding transcriptional ArsR family regulator